MTCGVKFLGTPYRGLNYHERKVCVKSYTIERKVCVKDSTIFFTLMDEDTNETLSLHWILET